MPREGTKTQSNDIVKQTTEVIEIRYALGGDENEPNSFIYLIISLIEIRYAPGGDENCIKTY